MTKAFGLFIRGRSRKAAIRIFWGALFLLAILVAAVALPGCSGGDDHPFAFVPDPETMEDIAAVLWLPA